MNIFSLNILLSISEINEEINSKSESMSLRWRINFWIFKITFLLLARWVWSEKKIMMDNDWGIQETEITEESRDPNKFTARISK